MSNDRQIIDSIRSEIGRDPIAEFEEGTCVSLSLWDEQEPFRGLIRHHDAAAQQRVLDRISRLRGLRALDIHQNWLRSLPNELAQLKELRSLNISSNHLGEIPEWIWGLHKLEVFHAGVNNLEKVSPRIGELTELKVLYLQKNRLRTLPREVLNLRGLNTLNLYFNPEAESPLWVTDLPDIEMFSWAVNSMTRFPQEIASWKKLKYLTLAGCAFEDIEGIEQCTSLLGARLNKGRLKKVPRDWSGMKTLRQITLQQNELNELPDSFAELHQLQMLNIAFNSFNQLPGSIFKIPNLRWLCAHDNPWSDPSEMYRLPETVHVVRDHPFGWQPPPIWNKLGAV
jgi:Leucine-rich repeat (LRR) protein